jgi:hypothetical protein
MQNDWAKAPIHKSSPAAVEEVFKGKGGFSGMLNVLQHRSMENKRTYTKV